MGWSANNFLPPLLSAQVIGAGTQVATTFFTFPGRGRIWSAHLAFSMATNNSFAVATQQFYSLIKTGSGIVFGGPVELSISKSNDHANDGADLKIDGMLVAANDTLQLDVNNGIAVTGGGGVMRASCVVLYSVP